MIELPEQYESLDVFIVGGYVRDSIRGEQSEDVDLMVTGVTADDLRERGFTPVENETFPVFHDDLGREVAIAREERSLGEGHTSFDVNAVPPDVPAEEAVERDLARRDFTINSMALDAWTGELYDPFDGREDIENGLLRHTTDAFEEDPLRILRGARFSARFEYPIADETLQEMRFFADEISSLPGERIRMEMLKTFEQASSPRTFFDVLDEADALGITFPELSALKRVPAGPDEHHREGSAYDHTMLVLDAMQSIRPNDPDALLAALVHDFGKGHTPPETLPGHAGHSSRGIDSVELFADRLSFSNDRRRLMKDACRRHMAMHDIEEMNPGSVFDLVDELHMSIETLIDLSRADSIGRIPTSEYPVDAARARLTDAQDAFDWTASDTMEFRDLEEDDIGTEISGERFGELLRMDRIGYMQGKR